MLGKKIYKPIITQEQCNQYAQVAEWCNNNNAHIEDKGECYEVVKTEVYTPTDEEIKQAKITELKAELASYDYIGVKIAMGVASVEEYADKIAYTQELRKQINELEAQ